jgi:DNA polymerase I-like protein with 3'-5' exonuclease and polymerase domains
MTPLVIDLETTIDNKDIGKFQADPEYPDNWIVAEGWKFGDNPVQTIYHKSSSDAVHISPPTEEQDVLVVGQNVAFDIYYLASRTEAWREWMSHGTIWDTMIVDYLITGQFQKYTNLDVLALQAHSASAEDIEFYKAIPKKKQEARTNREAGNVGGAMAIEVEIDQFYYHWRGVLKDDKIKEYWQAGVPTQKIPKEELIEYLESDVRNTAEVFEYQLALVQRMDLFSLVWVQMEARMATIEMQLNGTYINQQILTKLHLQRRKELDMKLIELEELVYAAVTPIPVEVDEQLNVASPTQLSKILFGGMFEYKTKEVMLDDDGNEMKYKSGAHKGEKRYKVGRRVHEFKPLLADKLEYTELTARAGIYQTGDGVMKKIIKDSDNEAAKEIAETVLELRGIKKDVSTYYEGYGALVWPHDSCIHPSYQHCSTDTGRLSCSSPNLQQVTGKGKG